jgi:hypothetical protein
MPSIATVTGKVGPDRTLTAQVFNLVTFFSIDTNNEVLDIAYNNGDGARRSQIDISAATTITCTVSGANYTLTIS